MINLDLSGKIAVVTGASGELGRVIGRTLAEAGAAVALHYYRSEDKAQATATEVNAAGGKAMIVQARGRQGLRQCHAGPGKSRLGPC